MGKLVVTEYLTLDGIGQAPGAVDEDDERGFAHGGWLQPLADPEAGDVVFDEASTMDALLLGRKTYEIFAEHWPSAPEEVPFTGLLNGVPKYVASRTLGEPLEWASSTVLGEPLGAEVRALKDRHDEVHVIGSLDLVQTLLREGLVDELQLWVFPIVLGEGKRLFASGTVPTALHLRTSTTYPSGGVHLVYDVAGVPTYGSMSG